MQKAPFYMQNTPTPAIPIRAGRSLNPTKQPANPGKKTTARTDLSFVFTKGNLQFRQTAPQIWHLGFAQLGPKDYTGDCFRRGHPAETTYSAARHKQSHKLTTTREQDEQLGATGYERSSSSACMDSVLPSHE